MSSSTNLVRRYLESLGINSSLFSCCIPSFPLPNSSGVLSRHCNTRHLRRKSTTMTAQNPSDFLHSLFHRSIPLSHRCLSVFSPYSSSSVLFSSISLIFHYAAIVVSPPSFPSSFTLCCLLCYPIFYTLCHFSLSTLCPLT